MIEKFWELISQNQLMIGGIVLMLTGSLIALFRKAPEHIWQWCLGLVTVKLEIRESDECYHWVKVWLSQKMPTVRDVSAYTTVFKSTGLNQKDTRPNIMFAPAHGAHWMWFHGRPAIVTRMPTKTTTPTPSKASEL